MPVQPYVWQANDYVSASRLMSELRQTGGAYYQPNGVRFHAERPIYKAYARTGFTPTANAWQALQSGTGGTYQVLADNWGTDPLGTGGFAGASLLNGSGLAGTSGGLAMMWGHVNFNTVAATYGQVGMGFADNSNSSFGTLQGSASYTPQCWAADLLDIGGASGAASVAIDRQSTATMATPTSLDGSGGVCHRTQGFWCSAYPANGTALAGSTLPSITTSIANGTSLTPAILNNTIQQSMNLLNMPPLFRANYSSSLASNTAFTPPYSSTSGNAFYDTYGAWNSGSNYWVAPLPGLYLVTSFGGNASAGPTWTQQQIYVNGSLAHAGPAYGTEGIACVSGTARILSLAAGDTVQHRFSLSSASAAEIYPNFTILWLGANVINPLSSTPAMIDTTYSFAAGTPASQIAAMLSNHVLADITNLVYRPYAAAWSGTAQTGMTSATWQTLNMDHYTFPLHGDSGSLYGTWSNSSWTAGINGWYLVNVEAYINTASAGTIVAGIAVSPAGEATPDFTNQMWAGAVSGIGQGSTALGLYYLMAGDSVQAKVFPIGTTAYTNGAGTYGSHMEIVWISE